MIPIVAFYGWLKDFKKNYKIRDMWQNMLSSQTVHLFQKQMCGILSKTDSCSNSDSPDYIADTDHTGCEYHINVGWKLSHKGEKTTRSSIRHQQNYAFIYCSASGKLLPASCLSARRKWYIWSSRLWRSENIIIIIQVCLCNCNKIR